MWGLGTGMEGPDEGFGAEVCCVFVRWLATGCVST